MKNNKTNINAIYFNSDINVKPILNNNLEESGYYIDENCNIYTKNINNKNEEIYIPYKMRMTTEGRLYSILNIEGKSRCYSAPRLTLMSFEAIHMPYRAYDEYEVDHIDPSKPLNNNIKNLEWVSHEENMRRAGETGVMIKKYDKDLVHEICKRLIKGETRKKIVEDLGINKNFVYDIRTGKSHRSVSKLYLDKGFEYHKENKGERIEVAREVCELIEQGKSNKEI